MASGEIRDLGSVMGASRIALPALGGHLIVLTTDGTVWAWGSNEWGQLGTARRASAPFWHQVDLPARIVAVAAGAQHTVALDERGFVWAWGGNADGQLGDGTLVWRHEPRPVRGLENVVSIAAGINFTLALRTDGTVWAWGSNWSGIAPDEPLKMLTAPVQVRSLQQVTAISVAEGRCEAVLAGGGVRTWGTHPHREPDKAGIPPSALQGRIIDLQKGWAVAWIQQPPEGTSELSSEPGESPVPWERADARESLLKTRLSAGDVSSLNPSSATVTEFGGWGVVTVTPATVGDHSWTVTGQPNWVTIIKDGGKFYWRAALNVGTAARSANLSIGGAVRQQFTLTQSGAQSVKSVQIAAGYGSNRSVALMGGGAMWTWGDPQIYPIPMTSSGAVAVALGYRPDTYLRSDGTVCSESSGCPVNGISGVIHIARGSDHFLAVRSDGSVWSWGSNYQGQLGDGSLINRYNPAPLNGMTGFVAVSTASYGKSFALRNDGTVWAWGYGFGLSPAQIAGLSGVVEIVGGYALKADGTLWSLSANPSQVAGIDGVIAVSQGGGHTLAIKSDGSVWAWGQNSYGQLGDGTKNERTTPLQVPGLTDIVAIAAGSGHSLALRSDGAIFGWGQNSSGQLGDNTTTDRLSPIVLSGLTVGQLVKASGDAQSARTNSPFGQSLAVQVLTPYGQPLGGIAVSFTAPATGASGTFAVGGTSAIAISDSNGLAVAPAFTANATPGAYSVSASAWGQSVTFALVNGTGGITGLSPSSIPVSPFGGWGAVNVTTAIPGDSTYDISGLPPWLRVVRTLSGLNWIASPNATNTSRSVVLVVGANGQSSPLTITQTAPPVGAIAALSGGRSHTLALNSGGTVLLWGRGVLLPRITGFPQGMVAIAAASDDYYSSYDLAVANNGKAWQLSYGSQSPTQIQAPTNVIAATPFWLLTESGTVFDLQGSQVAGLAGIVSISRTMALRNDGTVWVQGSTAPTQVSGLNKIVSISAGEGHVLALRNDGTVWCWGSNDSGQCGDGTSGNQRPTPVQVAGLSGVIAIAAGGSHSLAVKSDGAVWAWGSNSNGQLGDGTTSGAFLPRQVPGLTGVVSAAGGYAHSLVLDSSGRVWAWGSNSSGQLGDNSTAQRLSPVQTKGLALSAIKKISGDNQAVRGSVAFPTNLKVRIENELGSGYPGVEVTFAAPSSGAGGTFAGGGAISKVLTDSAGYATAPSFTSNGVTGIFTVTASVGALTTSFTLVNGTGDVLSIVPSSVSIDQFGGKGTVSVVPLTDGDSSWTVTGQPLWLQTWKSGNTLNWRATPNNRTSPRVAILTIGGPLLTQILTLTQAASNGVGVRRSSAGYGALARMADGTVRRWGDYSIPLPTTVPGIQNAESVSGELILLDDGTVWLLGVPNNAPTQVSGLTDVVAISSGGSQRLALRSDGTVWGVQSPPVQISGLSEIISIAAGAQSLALRSDGTVWAWQPGVQPTAVPLPDRAVAVSAGSRSLAVLTDGSVYVWQNYGAPVPSPVVGLSGVVDAVTNYSSILALKSDGTVLQSDSVNTPTAISGLTGIVAVVSSGGASQALRNDGTLWSWGSNDWYQLGDGTTTSRSSPVQSVNLGAYSLNASTINTTHTAGSQSLTLTALPAGSPWIAAPNASWLTVTPASGAGSAPIVVNWTANQSLSSRTTTLSIGDVVLTVTQAGAPVVYYLSAENLSVSAAAGSQSVTLSVSPSSATWSAVSSAPWLTVNPQSGTGGAQLTVSWMANPSYYQRTATLAFGDRVLTVKQAGVSSSYSLSTTSINAPATAGQQSVILTVSPSDAPWTASSNAPWLTIDKTSGAGTSTITLSWTANTLSASRAGTIFIDGYTVVVTQAAGAPNLNSKVGAFQNGSWILDQNGNFAWDGTTTDRLRYWSLGRTGEIPVVGDWNGDGKDEIGLYVDGTWQLDYNGNGIWDPGVDKLIFFGGAGYKPYAGDWNGDGKTDVGAYLNGSWILDWNGNYQWDGTAIDRLIYWSLGRTGEVPILGDWNGDGKTKLGLYVGGTIQIDFNGNGIWEPGTDKLVYYGGPGYTPYVGDWDGNGTDNVGAYQNGTWILDWNGNFAWDGAGADKLIYWSLGRAGEIPLLGDWNGNGQTKLGLYVDGTIQVDYDGNAQWSASLDKLAYFGGPGQKPVIGKW
ncbi:MAG: hypothetical protein HXY18_10305 [Bryobacteraceae bacterium]|nr:hypothetical protein [Bryobacteraceae bacterium]